MTNREEVASRPRITVGYDGSERSARGIDWAVGEAARRAATVHLVTCFGPPRDADPWLAVPHANVEAMRDAAVKLLGRQLAESQLRHPNVELTTEAVLGAPVDCLITEAEHSDLLVVGISGHGFFDAWRLGPVAAQLLGHAPCPVVVVPNIATRAHHNRVVVGADGSAASLHAVRWAADEADRRDAELLVVHAWSYPYYTELANTPGRDITNVDAAVVLEAAVREARARCAVNVEAELAEGPPAAELLTRGTRADLVVVGSRGRGQLRSMLLGSVAHAVSARATCPTAVLSPPPEH